MAGHSHSANIAIRKGAQDKKRGKLFTKLVKEIMVAAKLGGPDPDSNPRLRMAMTKARSNSMPRANIERAVAKGSGTLEGENYESLSMEGYGPGGVAVMCDVLTDNRNRAASEIRHAFSKGNGNLGTSGCVAYMFQRKGIIFIEKNEAEGVDEDTVMMVALDGGAEDITEEDNGFEVITTPDDFETVTTALEENEIPTQSAQILNIPDTRVELTGTEAEQFLRMIDLLDDCEDVQEITHNAEIPASELERIENKPTQ